jgi:DNA-binding response OmpR family regulator
MKCIKLCGKNFVRRTEFKGKNLTKGVLMLDSFKNILIVDDDYQDYFFMKESIEDYTGHLAVKLHYAGAFDEAIEFVRAFAQGIDLLILDYDLGLRKGDELFKEINKEIKVPAIFITGNLQPTLFRYLRDLGALDVFDKDSFDFREFLIKINSPMIHVI